MIETKDKVINGNTYSVTQFTALRALRLQYKIIKIFGAGIAQILRPQISQSEMGRATLNLGIDKDSLASAILNITSNMDENTFESLFKELLEYTRRDGKELKPAVIDLEFAGDLATLWQVIWFVLEVNFGSFFGERGFGSVLSETETQ